MLKKINTTKKNKFITENNKRVFLKKILKQTKKYLQQKIIKTQRLIDAKEIKATKNTKLIKKIIINATN